MSNSFFEHTVKSVKGNMKWVLIMALVLTVTAMSFAQTPVPIVVNTNDIFTQTNSWIAIFSPIVAIGTGIAIALAILTFIGGQILKAFRGG